MPKPVQSPRNIPNSLRKPVIYGVTEFVPLSRGDCRALGNCGRFCVFQRHVCSLDYGVALNNLQLAVSSTGLDVDVAVCLLVA